MTYQLRTSPKAEKYLKKLREKPLKELFKRSTVAIIENPYETGDRKSSDIAEYYSYDFKYKGVSYRLAYHIKEKEEIVVIVTAGPRENFYEELKRYVKSSTTLKEE